ncbi:MAG: protein-L-isoaspartate(D-aspartate) O-methyltransferase [bacterium]
MDEFLDPREHMVVQQIERRGVKDKRVLDAMRKVPRHEFIKQDFWSQAYNDYPLPTQCDQTISQPYIVALMTELLELKGTERVLEIGTGSGYQTAVLAEIASSVYSVERFDSLADSARQKLKGLGYTNIEIKTGDGTNGWPEEGPYNAILVTASTPSIPQPLIGQLAEGGTMVIPVGSRVSQDLIVLKKEDGDVTTTRISGVVFVPLIGEHGWKE